MTSFIMPVIKGCIGKCRDSSNPFDIYVCVDFGQIKFLWDFAQDACELPTSVFIILTVSEDPNFDTWYNTYVYTSVRGPNVLVHKGLNTKRLYQYWALSDDRYGSWIVVQWTRVLKLIPMREQKRVMWLKTWNWGHTPTMKVVSWIVYI
jgi:hypothetical protein